MAPNDTPVATSFDAEGFPLDATGKRIPGATAITDKTKQQQYIQEQGKRGPVPFSATTGEGFKPVATSGDPSSDANVNNLERMNLWETLKKRNQIPDESKVTQFARNMLNDLSCVENKSSGQLTVFNNSGGNAIFDITGQGVVGLRKNWDLNNKTSLASESHIDALLKGAATAKFTSGAAGANIDSPNPASQAMMEKAAQLAGLKVANPKFLKYGPDGKPDATALDAELEKIEPGLAAKMNKQAQGLKDKYDMNPEKFTPAAIKQPDPIVKPTDPAPAPTTATALTVDNVKAQLGAAVTSGKPTVMIVYNKDDPAAQKRIDDLAAASGGKVNILKMDSATLDALKKTDPAYQNLAPGMVAYDAAGKPSGETTSVPDTVEGMKKWIEGPNALKGSVFPPPAAPATVAVKPTPGVASDLTAANAGVISSAKIPTVLLIYAPDDPNSVEKANQLAAAAGDKVNVMKLDIHQLDALKGQIPAGTPLGDALAKGQTGLTVFDASGKAVGARQTVPGVDDIQTWVEKDVLKSTTPVFPPKAAPVTATPEYEYDMGS